MDYKEAADVFECMQDDKTYLADHLSGKQLTAIDFAARILRACAEGEQGFEAWRTQMLAEPVRKTVQYTDKDVFLSGHAAATAAMQAEVDALRAEHNRELFELAGGNLKAQHRAAKANQQLRADLDAVCGEVERLDSLATIETPKQYHDNRPPRITEILAARKEQKS